MNTTVLLGDCLDQLKRLEENSVDALVTDPPAGIEFMNLAFDSDRGGRDHWIAWLSQVMAEALRVLKPGGFGLVWALPRTSHWTATALEDAGFEVRDVIHALNGQGFPKNHNVSKAIDREAGAQRKAIGRSTRHGGVTNQVYGKGMGDGTVPMLTAPATDAAKQWAGFGTAMKPAAEHWWLVKKPISERSIAANVLKHGTGSLNIDACRVPMNGETVRCVQGGKRGGGYDVGSSDGSRHTEFVNTEGRWPPHVVLDEEAAAELDRQSGNRKSGTNNVRRTHDRGMFGTATAGAEEVSYGDAGGASRFFPVFRYQAKPSQAEKNAGLDGKNPHKTVKSIELMRWLIRLITPPGGTVLDPFCGSGTTGCACVLEGHPFIGIEQDKGYRKTAQRRIAYWRQAA